MAPRIITAFVLALAIIALPTPAHAGVITLTGNPSASTSNLANFTGSLTYTDSIISPATSATLQICDLPTTLRNFENPQVPDCEGRHGYSIIPLSELEKRAIIQAIEQLHGDKLEAARQLGIGKTTLYRKLKEYGALT